MPHETQLETSRSIPHYWAWLAALGFAVTIAYAAYEVMKTLNGDATALNIECRAQACTTRQDTGEARQLLNGRSISLPIKQGIHLTFSRVGISSK
jgi:hypothetical protein